jgi:hypothetical protein
MILGELWRDTNGPEKTVKATSRRVDRLVVDAQQKAESFMREDYGYSSPAVAAESEPDS